MESFVELNGLMYEFVPFALAYGEKLIPNPKELTLSKLMTAHAVLLTFHPTRSLNVPLFAVVRA
jgi:hypothetical protein